MDCGHGGRGADRRSVGSVALAGSEVVVATRDGARFGVITRGWVYASTEDGYVVALQVGDRTLDGWHMFGGDPRHDGLVAPAPEPRRGV